MKTFSAIYKWLCEEEGSKPRKGSRSDKMYFRRELRTLLPE